MREVATRDRIEAFLSALAREAPHPTRLFLVGGTSAVIEGWRDSTMDIDLVIRPESDALLRAIPALKEKLNLNVELAAPDHFIPVLPGWESRSPEIKRIGNVVILHYDFTAQALSKIERGHVRDLADVRAMLSRGLIARSELRAQYAQIEPELYRYPAIDPASFRQALESLLEG
jgi:hypothetical protein